MSSSARLVWFLNVLLVSVVVAGDTSLRQKATNFWKDISVYPVILGVVAGTIFICCCVLPKVIRLTLFVGILGGGGFLAYKAIKEKFA